MATVIITTTNMRTDQLAALRLMQLVSPALPIGGFTYSQGLEWAVETRSVSTADELSDWLSGVMDDTITQLEIPILARSYSAFLEKDEAAVRRWSDYLIAARETRELRQEERNRGRALAALLPSLGVADADRFKSVTQRCQAAGFALAAVSWRIPLEDAAHGYAWSWLENQVAAGIKLIPLGQTEGQKVQFELAARLPACVATGLALSDDEIGASSPALAIASSRHETQYTRLFRS